MTEDERFMAMALEEAQAAAREGNTPFGAVITREGTVLARAHNLVESDNDPTAHGEVVAVRAACQRLGKPSLEEATLYTTCEPCVLCTGAIMWARIARVVIGAAWSDAPGYFHPEKGSLLGLASQLRYPFQYTTGVLKDECSKLYSGG